MRYSIFAHQSEYHLREELAVASPEDLELCDWGSLAYTLKQWPRALEALCHDCTFICIMDEKFRIYKQWSA